MPDRTLLGRRAWITVAAFVLLVTLVALPPPAEASFPGKNGKIAIHRKNLGIYTINPDGSGLTFVTTGAEPAWSPDGTKLAFRGNDGIYVSNANGTGATRIVASGTDPAWSPDGTQLVYKKLGSCDLDGFCSPGQFIRVNRDGTGATPILTNFGERPDWSPDGSEIVFDTCEPPCAAGADRNIWVMNAGGGGLRQLSHGEEEVQAAWAPNAQKVLYEDRSPDNPPQSNLETMNRDGTGANVINTTLGWWRGVEGAASWAPDGTQIATSNRYGPCEPTCRSSCTPGCYFDLFLVDADESAVTRVTDFRDVIDADWQPLPVTYPRPQGAAPLRASLVPAYRSCDPEQATLTHGSPLAQPSCASPSLTSGYLTQGSPDANGAAANGIGYARISETGESPISSANGDQADVYLQLQMADVREASDLSDYTGELQVRPTLRITDKLNTPTPGVGYAATVSDISLSYDVPCLPTASSTTGSHCGIATTADALVPNMVREAKRAIWELGKIRVFDGGPDGDAQTAPNTLFAVQGVFVP